MKIHFIIKHILQKCASDKLITCHTNVAWTMYKKRNNNKGYDVFADSVSRSSAHSTDK